MRSDSFQVTTAELAQGMMLRHFATTNALGDFTSVQQLFVSLQLDHSIEYFLRESQLMTHIVITVLELLFARLTLFFPSLLLLHSLDVSVQSLTQALTFRLQVLFCVAVHAVERMKLLLMRNGY